MRALELVQGLVLAVIVSSVLGFVLVMGEHFVISEAFCNAAAYRSGGA